MFRTLSALASLVAASTALVPTASNAQDSTSVLVPYSDLNLASAGGQDRLQRRIFYAAKNVCAGEATYIALGSASLSCRTAAVASARPAYEAAVAEATRHGTVTVLGSASLIVTKP